MQTYAELRDQTISALNDGDNAAAFRSLRTALDFGLGILDPQSPDFQEAIRLFARISEHFAVEDFVKLVRTVADAPDDVQALYDLGYALNDEQQFPVAATVLARADQLAPGEPVIISEFVSALEHCGLSATAVEVLERYSELTREDFLLCYLLAFNLIMSGTVDGAREQFEVLPSLSDGSDEHVVMETRIRQFLTRFDQVAAVTALDETDLRGWQFVTTGAVLTHLSPYGFPEPMNGRYAFMQDSYDYLRQGLTDLQRRTTITGFNVERVTGLNDRSSQILALAAARYFDVPPVPWSDDVCRPGTLVVAYDMSAIEDLSPFEKLRFHNGELLYSHAMNWVDACPLAPDVVTLLYQHITAPWEPQMRADPETDEIGYTEPDERPDSDVADEILSTEPEPHEGDGEPPALSDAFLRATGPIPVGGSRESMWNCSPVGSNRFA